MKIIVIGASGLLGSKLYSYLGHYFEMAGTYYSQKADNLRFLDITNYNGVEKLFAKIDPDIVIHCAANINSDDVEKDKRRGREVNETGTKNVAVACKRSGCRLIYISSDYVFGRKDGAFFENDEYEPVNYYGQTKANAERFVMEELDDFIIIRPSMLYGLQERGGKNSFLARTLDALCAGKKIRLDDKTKKYPLLIDDLALLIKTLIDMEEHGIFHISSTDGISRYEMARMIAKEFSFSERLVAPSKERGRVARRPNDLRLDIRKINHLGIYPVNFREGIRMIRQQMGCMFKMIYSLRPDKLLLGQNASLFRVKLGRELARSCPVRADVVVPIPESGIFFASGYSEESGVPMHFGLIRDYYTLRTLYEPRIETRSSELRRKLIVVPELVKDKRVVLIDEALLSGSTIEASVQKLKDAGAKEIHIRIPSPPMVSHCEARVLRRKVHLLAKDYMSASSAVDKKRIETALVERFRIDSFKFLALDRFLNYISEKGRTCYRCFTSGPEVSR